MTPNETVESPPLEQERGTRSPAEWISFGIASFILAGIVGLISYSWLGQSNEPPTFQVKSQEVIKDANGQFYVPFEVTNTGGQTVETVQILAELKVNGQVMQTGEQQIDFLASHETENGAFVFTHDPKKGELVVRVGSYKLP